MRLGKYKVYVRNPRTNRYFATTKRTLSGEEAEKEYKTSKTWSRKMSGNSPVRIVAVKRKKTNLRLGGYRF